MKTLPSKLFPDCSFTSDEDAGFYDITPEGFNHIVSLYLSIEVVKDDKLIVKAAAFFDRLHEWNDFCRTALMSAEQKSEEFETIMEYFSFYKEEAPEVFGEGNVPDLSLADMVKSLQLSHMGTHGSGAEQRYNVDFTLGYDQLLTIYFDSDCTFERIAWES